MATARTIDVTQEDLASAERSASGAAYSRIETPGEHIGIVNAVADYDKRAEGGKHGWVWTIEIGGVPFTEYTAFTKAGKWRLLELLGALDPGLDVGELEVDPDVYVGVELGVYVNWSIPDDEWDGQEKRYREMERFFPIVDDSAFEALDDTEDPEEI